MLKFWVATRNGHEPWSFSGHCLNQWNFVQWIWALEGTPGIDGSRLKKYHRIQWKHLIKSECIVVEFSHEPFRMFCGLKFESHWGVLV